MSTHLNGCTAVKRSSAALLIAVVAATVALAAGSVSAAGASGGAASHDTWQVGLSFKCDNPSFCGDNLGGFEGRFEFDRAADGTITGDAELTGTGHSVGGGGPGSGRPGGHIDLEITAAHIGVAEPGDPNPGGPLFYVDHNVVTFRGAPPTSIVDDPFFLGDSGIPAAPGHYSQHPAPGVDLEIQVAFRPAT